MPSVDIPIIGQLVHPSIGLLTEVLQGTHGPGPLDLSLVPPQGPTALTYGVRVQVFTQPADWSIKLGNPNVFNPPFIQLSSTYVTLGGATELAQQITWVDTDGFCYFWEEALPSHLLVHIEPVWVVTLSWLQT